MSAKLRKIEVDTETAELLEARANARGLSVSELLADLLGEERLLPSSLRTMRAERTGPWAPDVLAEDRRRLTEFLQRREGVPWDEIKAWMNSWGTPNELPPPDARKL